MKLREIGENRNYYTETLSKIVRQLDFAGIAVVWIFRVAGENGQISFSSELLWALGFFVSSLILDLLQYAYASAAWSCFFRRCETKHKLKLDGDRVAPRSINWPTNASIKKKTILVAGGYYTLLSEIVGRIT